MPTRRHSHRRSGVVLLLSLILMMTITASTIGVAAVIGSTTRQSQNLSDFITASLAADSGLERGLMAVKLGRVDQSLDTTVSDAIPPALADLRDADGNIIAQYGLLANNTANAFQIKTLHQNESAVFDVYKDQAGNVPLKLKIEGDPTPLLENRLQVSWIIINSDGTTTLSGRTDPDLTIVAKPACDQINLLDNIRTEIRNTPGNQGTGQQLGFRVRVTATKNDLFNLSFTPQSIGATCTTGDTNLSNQINMTSTGTAGNTRSEKNASVLWQLPSSPLFNYVLFTEGDIIPQ